MHPVCFFSIGVEAYTVGSAEFSLSYAAMNKGRCIPLMDNGHYHPTEVVSDKIPALLAFFPEIALHITRPIRWDSDHVVLLDDETREICKEIVHWITSTPPSTALPPGLWASGIRRRPCSPR